jgi:hypothetical protein
MASSQVCLVALLYRMSYAGLCETALIDRLNNRSETAGIALEAAGPPAASRPRLEPIIFA